MNRRTFLLASVSLLTTPMLARPAAAASPWLASTTLAEAHRYLGTRYVYGGNDPYKGIDCSAYVSVAWGIPRQSTDTIHNWSYKIRKDQLMPGDSLNLPFVGRRRHIRIFAGWATEDRSIAWMYEAARSRGVDFRVVGYDDAYTPIRRVNFVADVPLPEPVLPLEYDVSNGRFFSQTGGNDGLLGFTLTDADRIRFWSELRRLGGVEVLGRPVTRRFDSHGRTVQVLERSVLHWNAAEQRVEVGPFPPDLRTAAPAEAQEPERSPYLPKL